jgi:hypothetical protein
MELRETAVRPSEDVDDETVVQELRLFLEPDDGEVSEVI